MCEELEISYEYKACHLPLENWTVHVLSPLESLAAPQMAGSHDHKSLHSFIRQAKLSFNLTSTNLPISKWKLALNLSIQDDLGRDFLLIEEYQWHEHTRPETGS